LVDFDVLVVGAGPSGIWAAVTAARCGARVGLVERQARIGEHVRCGEGIQRDPLAEMVEVDPEWVASEVHGVRLFAPNGTFADLAEPGVGVITHKDLFLRALARLAAAEGVEIWPGAEAVGLKAGERRSWMVDVRRGSRRSSLRCGAVVAADGIASSVARELKLKGPLAPVDLFVCAQYTVAPIDVDPSVIEFHFGRDVAPGGYAWVFPKGEAVANVGVGMVAGVPGNLAPVEYLARFKQRRCRRSKTVAFIVGGVPSERNPFKACAGGVFLCGDAARIADQITGAGIIPGMESGAIAGKHAFMHAAGEARPDMVAKSFVKSLRAHFKNRRMRSAVRVVLTRMGDADLTRLVGLVGEFAAGGRPVRRDPVALLRFVARSMPTSFNIARHLVGV
jgi:digeranylgeranylglycerophospholipid reductase